MHIHIVNSKQYLSASVIVSSHSSQILSSSVPSEYIEHERSTLKVNMWCALTSTEIIDLFLQAVNINTYVDMPEIYAFPQFKRHADIFQQDDASSHIGNIV
jgi:hypothetical protein